MTTIPAGTQEEVSNVAGNMAYTTYRWLTYQFDLDAGVEDQKLADQQHEFLADINRIAQGMAGEELLKKPGDFVCDVAGFISQTFAYNYAALPDAEGNKPSEELQRERYDRYSSYAMESAPIKAMLSHLGGSQSSIDSYMEMRKHHHSVSATVLRTLLIDYAMDWDWVEKCGDSWHQQYKDASIYLFFFDCNSDFTSYAIKWVLLSAFTYSARGSTKERKDALTFVFNLIDKMIDYGERTMRSPERLVGQALLDKVRGIPKMDLWLLSVQCGYIKGVDDAGEAVADVEAFREAYLAETAKFEDAPAEEPKKSKGIQKPTPVHITLSDEVRNESFVKGLSEESIEVIEHFGTEAAHLLNQYSCSLEDALLKFVDLCKEKDAKIEDLEENVAAMNKMLTDPETLRKYTNEFFGPDGAYPSYKVED